MDPDSDNGQVNKNNSGIKTTEKFIRNIKEIINDDLL